MSMNSASGNSVDEVLRTTQIVMGALVAGVTIFLVIVVCLVHVGGFVQLFIAAIPANKAPPARQPAQAIPLLTYLSAGMGIIVLLLSFILPNVIATQGLRAAAARARNALPSPTSPSGGAITPANAFQTSTIMGGALNEGAAFFAAIAYLLEQNPIALGACGILLAALVLRFPTRGRFERWVARQEEKLRWE
jgi:hypothetical protein